MSRYADAEYVKAVMLNDRLMQGNAEFTLYEQQVDVCVKALPSIDIVRCRECVKANTKDCSHSYWDDDWGVWRIGYKGDDWFCADGEREGE